ncbi:hypothetical protein NB311A_12017 [Nitrobacter sp. Nb-311A]|uniref:hypothetical protein n=1 Tax=Nitrobacter sp. Nb-311A TaxID=314253 RepID=UPI00006852DB|nr:hypothetical protein [Nitrobacter sp. Nb-311A]EAQ34467.1 hypothetical protein NB311A_12017 [Nitrobacter sp. Nb-311A]
MTDIIAFPRHRQTIIQVMRAWVHPPGQPLNREWSLVVVLIEPDGGEVCVWSGQDWREAVEAAEIWCGDYPGSRVVVSYDPDDDDDPDDDGERMAA